MFCVWLKDDYKTQCGQWALHFIYGGHLGYKPKKNYLNFLVTKIMKRSLGDALEFEETN